MSTATGKDIHVVSRDAEVTAVIRKNRKNNNTKPVSYTHLTLPTIRLV